MPETGESSCDFKDNDAAYARSEGSTAGALQQQVTRSEWGMLGVRYTVVPIKWLAGKVNFKIVKVPHASQ